MKKILYIAAIIAAELSSASFAMQPQQPNSIPAPPSDLPKVPPKECPNIDVLLAIVADALKEHPEKVSSYPDGYSSVGNIDISDKIPGLEQIHSVAFNAEFPNEKIVLSSEFFKKFQIQGGAEYIMSRSGASTCFYRANVYDVDNRKVGKLNAFIAEITKATDEGMAYGMEQYKLGN